MKNILQHTNHRPWPIPAGMWLWYQEWNNTVFLHLPVSEAWLRDKVPAGLVIDTIGGQAWISIVVFRMERIRPRFLPAVSAMSDFNEINIRTYVKVGNKAGVYFMSMEGDKQFSVYLARSISGLPYRYTTMQYDHEQLVTPFLSFTYSPVEDIVQKTELDKWLSERYCLFFDRGATLYCYDIHHVEWPLQMVSTDQLHIKYPMLHSLGENIQPQLCHYSKGVRVVAWGTQRIA